jgi:protein-disulfide isomerase
VAARTTEEPETTELTMPISERDHAQGPVEAPVTLVEYGDYECPYCGQAYPIIKNIQKDLGDKLRFVFRNFPITQVHPHAQQAAEGAEAAGAQNKFWEMHDRLYEHQQALSNSDLKQHASALGMDIPRFEGEMSNHIHAGRVREDFMSGIRSGVNGTPTFYINGSRYDDSWDEETLLETIRQEIVDNERATTSKATQRTANRRVRKGTRNKTEYKKR